MIVGKFCKGNRTDVDDAAKTDDADDADDA